MNPVKVQLFCLIMSCSTMIYLSFFENTEDPDQLAFDKAIGLESTLFSKSD